MGLALTMLAFLSLLDFLAPRGGWYADHPMTAAAVSAVGAFVAAGLFLDGWLREREARRLDRISTVAYRSLAQYANDAGRTLLAPLTGADLYELGVPEATPQQVAKDRARLHSHGHGASFEETTGSWAASNRIVLREALKDMLTDPGFVRELFRRTAIMRRRLQEVTALWAPVMLTSRSYAEDLGRLRDLTDALELLQEHLRRSGIIARGVGDWQAASPWISAVTTQYWHAIETYEQIRDSFGDLAELPSDTIVRRRRRLR